MLVMSEQGNAGKESKKERKESMKVVEIVSGTLVFYSQERLPDRQRIVHEQSPISVSHAMLFFVVIFGLFHFPCP